MTRVPLHCARFGISSFALSLALAAALAPGAAAQSRGNDLGSLPKQQRTRASTDEMYGLNGERLGRGAAALGGAPSVPWNSGTGLAFLPARIFEITQFKIGSERQVSPPSIF